MARLEIVWRILTMHCDEASRLSSESLDHDLATADKLACRLHLLICGDCRRHRRDILELRRIGRSFGEPSDRPDSTLPEQDRARIKRALKSDDPAL